MAAKDAEYMRLALEQARRGAELGFVPVGAVLVQEGRVSGWGHNARHGSGNLLGHAELVALGMATSLEGDWRLPRTTLYVTLEPCLMCAGAILHARVERLVFGCRDLKAGAVRSLYALLEDPRQTHQVRVEEGLLKEECRLVLTKFFEKVRKGNALKSNCFSCNEEGWPSG